MSQRDADDDHDDEGDAPLVGSVGDDLDPRVKLVLELVYQVEGVVGAKVWSMPDRVAVGVRIGNGHGVSEVLARVEAATNVAREPGEAWDYGLLDGDA
jgi:hypothetical protein